MDIKNIFVKGWYKNWSTWLILFMLVASIVEANMDVLPDTWLPIALTITLIARNIKQLGLAPAFLSKQTTTGEGENNG